MARKKVSASPVTLDSVGTITKRLLSQNVSIKSLPVISGGTANFNIGCPITSKEHMRCIAQHLWNVEWQSNGKQHTRPIRQGKSAFTPALLVKYRNPKATIRLWQTGNAAVIGATSPGNAKLAARKFCRSLQKLGFATKLTNFSMSNIIASARLPDEHWPVFLNLERLNRLLDTNAAFEAELHHTLSWRPIPSVETKQNMFVLAYNNGKFVFTGFKHYEDILHAYELMLPFLMQPGIVEILS